MTLAVLPLQKAVKPSERNVRPKQSMMPLYLRSRRPALIISSCASRNVSDLNTGRQFGSFGSSDSTKFGKTYLVLDEKLHSFDGSGGGLRDGGSNTTHCRSMSA